jgi:hypothetical protein
MEGNHAKTPRDQGFAEQCLARRKAHKEPRAVTSRPIQTAMMHRQNAPQREVPSFPCNCTLDTRQ